jgi:hypothetical protein
MQRRPAAEALLKKNLRWHGLTTSVHFIQLHWVIDLNYRCNLNAASQAWGRKICNCFTSYIHKQLRATTQWQKNRQGTFCPTHDSTGGEIAKPIDNQYDTMKWVMIFNFSCLPLKISENRIQLTNTRQVLSDSVRDRTVRTLKSVHTGRLWQRNPSCS